MSPVKREYDASSRRAAAEATRDRICAAAEERFLRDGYARTSIRTVAKAADVAEATMISGLRGQGGPSRRRDPAGCSR